MIRPALDKVAVEATRFNLAPRRAMSQGMTSHLALKPASTSRMNQAAAPPPRPIPCSARPISLFRRQNRRVHPSTATSRSAPPQARKLYSHGLDDGDVADFFEIAPATLDRWRRHHPDFAAAIARGKAGADDRVERSLYQRAVGYHCLEEKVFTPTQPVFRTPFLYKLVRHPLYSGFILAFWAIPVMTAGHLLLAVAMSAYILIAIQHEERDLVGQFGERYVEYRGRVGMLAPRLRR